MFHRIGSSECGPRTLVARRSYPGSVVGRRRRGAVHQRYIEEPGPVDPEFDHIVLLSAPADVIVQRLTARTNNPYGKTSTEFTETLLFLQTVEPALRSRATLEIHTTASVEQVVSAILGRRAGVSRASVNVRF